MSLKSELWMWLMWDGKIISLLEKIDKRRWRVYGAASELIVVGGSRDFLGASF